MKALMRPYHVDTPIGSADSRYYFDSVDAARQNGYVLYYESPTVYVFIKPHAHIAAYKWAFVFRGLRHGASDAGVRWQF